MTVSIDLKTAPYETSGGPTVRRKTNFQLSFEVPAGMDTDSLDLISISVQSISYPTKELVTEEIRYTNEWIKVVVGAKVGDIEMRSLDFVEKSVAKLLWEWSQMAVTSPGEGGYPVVGIGAQYKTNGTIILQGPDVAKEGQNWKVIGIFPQTVRFGEGVYGDAGPVEISTTFSIDRIVPVFS